MDAAADAYFRRSAGPLHALALVGPMVVAYELGRRGLGPGAGDVRVLAIRDLDDFFRGLGATGRLLPAAAVVAILLTDHVARGDRWRVNAATVGGMAAESAALGVPLLILAAVMAAFVPLAAAGGGAGGGAGLGPMVLLSIGAGVYEELLFRLVGVTLLVLALRDGLGLPRLASGAAAVGAMAVAFSLYHYRGGETFAWGTFAFRTIAGVYFGLLLWLRGFGIAAGAHAAYDLLVVAARHGTFTAASD